MKAYLYAVQDDNGREVCSATVEVDKVSEVTAEFSGEYILLLHNGKQIGDAEDAVRDASYTLHRWPADDKHSAPVSHPVK